MRNDGTLTRVDAQHYTNQDRDKFMQEYQENKNTQNLHRVVESNLRLVTVLVASKFRSNNISREDLIQTGYIALIEAIQEFNPKVGMKFSSYFMWYLLTYVGRYIKRSSGIVSPPINSDFWKNKERVSEFRRVAEYKDLYETMPGTNDLRRIDTYASEDNTEEYVADKEHVTKLIKLVKTYYKNRKNTKAYSLLLDRALGLNSFTKAEIVEKTKCKPSAVDSCSKELIIFINRAQHALNSPPKPKKHAIDKNSNTIVHTIDSSRG